MDHFTHGDEMQKTHGHWYAKNPFRHLTLIQFFKFTVSPLLLANILILNFFISIRYFHRQGKTFRNGTYKGLDFTIGNSKVFGGVLIRAVENLTEGTLIEGPSLVVDHILNLNDVGSIDELVQGFTVSALTKSKQLYISDIASSPTSVAHKYSAEKVYTCPRVGLTLKKNDNNQAKFIMRHYRFFLRPSKLKKGKVNIVLSLIHDGLSVDKIFQISASPKKSIEKYMDMYEKGKSKNPAEFYGQALNTDDMCYLYGACVGSDE